MCVYELWTLWTGAVLSGPGCLKPSQEDRLLGPEVALVHPSLGSNMELQV